jgi:hypothetical protein
VSPLLPDCEAQMTEERLKEELETYEAKRQELLASGEGKYVLIHGKDVIGIWDTYEDALKTGYRQFGLTNPFLVKQISGIERVLLFTRDISCQS